MTSIRDLTTNDLEWREQHRYPGKDPEMPEIFAMDTETEQGRIGVIADSNDFAIMPENVDDVLKFMSRRKYRSKTGVFYNLGFDASVIIRALGTPYAEELYYLGTTQFKNYTLKYIPDKMFRIIDDSGHSYYYFDISQFFFTTLEKAAKEYLDIELKSMDYDRIEEKAYWRDHVGEIRQQCIADSKATAQLAKILAREAVNLGVRFDRPYSTGYVAGQYVQSQIEYPRCAKRQFIDYSMKAYFGGRFEITKRGYFPKAYYYDINSAYPYQLARLPDFKCGTWVEGASIHPDTSVGFYECEVSTNCEYVTPVAREGTSIFFPNVHGETCYLEKEEVELLRELDDCDVRILSGWSFVPYTDHKPFAWITDMYDRRKSIESDNPVLGLFIKIIMNSIYGKTIETQTRWTRTNDPKQAEATIPARTDKSGMLKKEEKIGSLFYPPIGAAITARTRVQLYRAMRKAGDSLIAAFTDCVVMSEEMDICGEGLGAWNLDKTGECLMVQSGVYTFRDGDKISTAFRGFANRSDIDLFKRLREADDKKVVLTSRKPVTLGEALMQQRFTWKDVGKFVENPRILDINSGSKRIWDREATCADLLTEQIDSRPRGPGETRRNRCVHRL